MWVFFLFFFFQASVQVCRSVKRPCHSPLLSASEKYPPNWLALIFIKPFSVCTLALICVIKGFTGKKDKKGNRLAFLIYLQTFALISHPLWMEQWYVGWVGGDIFHVLLLRRSQCFQTWLPFSQKGLSFFVFHGVRGLCFWVYGQSQFPLTGLWEPRDMKCVSIVKIKGWSEFSFLSNTGGFFSISTAANCSLSFTSLRLPL